MKKRLLFLCALIALLCAFCFSAGAIKEDRPYKENKWIKIIDHVVYEYRNSPNQRPKKHYAVIDYFDTDEAANDPKIAKTVKIVDKIGKFPVTEIDVSVFDEWMDATGDWVDGTADGGCASPYTKRIVLPDSVTRLNTYAFAGFGFSSFTLPERFTVIPESTFEGCRYLRKIEIQGQLTEIRAGAFKDCVHLKAFTFPSSLKRIGGGAFRNTGLHKVSLSNKTLCDSFAFADCGSLTKVSFRTDAAQGGLAVSEGQFMGCSFLQTVVFPKNVGGIYLCDEAFRDCLNLKTVKNVSELKRIGFCAFERCWSLRMFTVPAGIEYVHPFAFLSCPALTTLYLNSENPDLLRDCQKITAETSFGEGNFIDYLRNDCMIYVQNEDMLRMVQEEALHSKAEIAA